MPPRGLRRPSGGAGSRAPLTSRGVRLSRVWFGVVRGLRGARSAAKKAQPVQLVLVLFAS